mmetsp:Transcript_23918/g.35121  ORF Transcript_23918/g.35121 Transcript_23918/m.35121 type:complete len:85 (+) Transcript_23918:704-958(+)
MLIPNQSSTRRHKAGTQVQLHGTIVLSQVQIKTGIALFQKDFAFKYPNGMFKPSTFGLNGTERLKRRREKRPNGMATKCYNAAD